MTPDEFLHRMVVVFGAPDTPDDDLFIDEYRAVIGTPNPRILAVAFSILRDEHEFKSWPVPAMVKRAIGAAALRVSGPPRPNDDIEHQNPRANPSAESRARVADLVANMVSNMGEEEGPQKFPFDVSRPAFEAMQRSSKNPYMHRLPPLRNGRGG